MTSPKRILGSIFLKYPFFSLFFSWIRISPRIPPHVESKEEHEGFFSLKKKKWLDARASYIFLSVFKSRHYGVKSNEDQPKCRSSFHSCVSKINTRGECLGIDMPAGRRFDCVRVHATRYTIAGFLIRKPSKPVTDSAHQFFLPQRRDRALLDLVRQLPATVYLHRPSSLLLADRTFLGRAGPTTAAARYWNVWSNPPAPPSAFGSCSFGFRPPLRSW